VSEDKYAGHTPEPWGGLVPATKPNLRLIRDAPTLLRERDEARSALAESEEQIRALTQRLDDQAALDAGALDGLRKENADLTARLSALTVAAQQLRSSLLVPWVTQRVVDAAHALDYALTATAEEVRDRVAKALAEEYGVLIDETVSEIADRLLAAIPGGTP